MSLQSSLPWTTRPLIINAPMGGSAGADLAIAVTNAGGLGQIGAVNDVKDLTEQLQKADTVLDRYNGLLPIGVGLLTFLMDQDSTLEVLAKFKPAVVWLFAAKDLQNYTRWASAIRKVLPSSQVWVQVGSVAGAVRIAQETRPDAICLQGTDAGGHGFENGASIVSLVPEVLDALHKAGLALPILAAGGIADGRAVAAALTLGADGVVMGTRFLSATETRVHPNYRAAVIEASDGGQNTVRSKVFDELRGPNRWPALYDGRGLRTASYADHEEGVGIDELRRRHADALKEGNAGFAKQGAQTRAAAWASTAVGLVRKEQGAAEIVKEVRAGTIAALEAIKARL